jgi:hypothetical protein
MRRGRTVVLVERAGTGWQSDSKTEFKFATPAGCAARMISLQELHPDW